MGLCIQNKVCVATFCYMVARLCNCCWWQNLQSAPSIDSIHWRILAIYFPHKTKMRFVEQLCDMMSLSKRKLRTEQWCVEWHWEKRGRVGGWASKRGLAVLSREDGLDMAWVTTKNRVSCPSPVLSLLAVLRGAGQAVLGSWIVDTAGSSSTEHVLCGLTAFALGPTSKRTWTNV